MSRNPRTIFEVPYIAPPGYGPSPQQLVNPLMELWLEAGAAVVTVTQQQGVWTSSTTTPRNPALDTVFDCRRLGGDGLPVGIPVILMSMLGTWRNISIVAGPAVAVTSMLGTWTRGKLFSSSALTTFTVTMGGGGTYSVPTIVTTPAKANWIQWSNIGHLDFTVGRDNVAGERPLDWKGWIYAIKKLGSKSVVYGQGGVTLLTPAGNVYGMQTINRIGLKGKHAVCGTDSEHYFVDAEGHLYQLDDKLDFLDYCEYLDTLGSSIVMSYDEANKLIYICDGASGFVYSIADKSLGEGPANVTGIGSQGGTLYVAAPTAVSIPVFDICTDIYDFGTREGKVITELDFGLNTSKVMSVSLDYRSDKAASFSQTGWHTVDAKGKAFIPCYGHEFRFRIKAESNEYFNLDYINIKGGINFIGERPLDFERIYRVKILNGGIVVYGNNGVAVMAGRESIKELHRLSPKSRASIAGSESIHFFIDTENQLWSLSDSLTLLDYSEYLSTMEDQVLSFDAETNLLYICDGKIGYVYSPRDGSLGEGPVNITGVGSQYGAHYVAAPGTIFVPTFEICTDIYDFGTRKAKTIRSVELGTDLTETLTVAIDYRRDKASAFLTTPWRTVNAEGIAFITCYGNEFRIKAKSSAYEYFELDYLTLSGAIHDY